MSLSRTVQVQAALALELHPGFRAVYSRDNVAAKRYTGASAASMNGIRLRESSAWGSAIAMHQALRRSGAAVSRLKCQWRA